MVDPHDPRRAPRPTPITCPSGQSRVPPTTTSAAFPQPTVIAGANPSRRPTATTGADPRLPLRPRDRVLLASASCDPLFRVPTS
ncbi:proline-rich receptor-like protein kinase PERK9 [Iris pallida]|uniref:Proline-rich receptor-like protein kinase PERK9 n=1 Tax=Iris pallida TaxID=29817 RepID=A0AAX6EEB2_IRIPA|nr:proline-rich receptor-like protein kinase PERK9 [Iris pallida]